MRIAVLYSGQGCPDLLEEADTVLQMEEVVSTLMQMDHSVVPVAYGEARTKLRALRQNLDLVFNLVESVEGSDARIYEAAELFESFNLPYTGCGAASLRRLASKTEQKLIMREHHLPTPDFIGADLLEYLVDGAPSKFIVKSDTEHASVGLDSTCLVEGIDQAKKLIALKSAEYGEFWFAESFIDGREFNISVLGRAGEAPRVLPPAEMLFVDYPDNMPKIVDYKAKWEQDSFAYSATVRSFTYPDSDRELLSTLCDLSVRAFELFELTGAARVDFRVDSKNRPFILEVNANPCLTSDAGFMAAAREDGLSAARVLETLFPVSES